MESISNCQGRPRQKRFAYGNKASEKGMETEEEIEEENGICSELQESLEYDFQPVVVEWEDIVKTASMAKKSTGGGLCQLTPWHLKAAVTNSSGNKCAKALAVWANR